MQIRRITLILAVLAAALLVAAPAAPAAKKKPRPTVKVVKAAFTDTWDTEFEHSTGGPGTISLRFQKIRLGKTRRSGAESITVPYGTWITPVQATFIQTIVQESRELELSSPYVQPTSKGTRTTTVTRVVALGNFYKSDFGWRYVPKGAKTTELSSRTEPLG